MIHNPQKRIIGLYVIIMENIIANVRRKTPLVHNITNYVTVNDCANVLLACGGSPIMADDAAEVEEITSICDALNINIGTLNSRTIEAMFIAGRRAKELKHPVILDPVGAGASRLRTETAMNIVNELKPDVIKGNISEIKTIYEGTGSTKGVDADEKDAIAADNLEMNADMAKKLSERTGAVIVITGAIDIVADSERAYAVYNGHRLMSKVSGTGCMLSAMLGAYVAANPDRVMEAVLAAVCVMGMAGERAVKNAIKLDAGNGSLRTYIIDEIYKMTDEGIKDNARYEEIGGKKMLGWKSKLLSNSLKLYAVTDRYWLDEDTLYRQVEKAIKGGATFIQLREKDMDYDDLLAEAVEIKMVTDRYNVPFVINDNVDIAIQCGADGVHVGQSDMDAQNVRQLMGNDKIVGVSVHNVDEAVCAERSGADYLGVGAMFATSTKDDAGMVSYETLRQICEAVSIPVVAIGGITSGNVKELKGSGISGAAVVSAIFGAKDIEQAARELACAVEEIL